MKKRLSLAFASLGLAAACSSPSGPDPVSGLTIPLEAGSTLVFLDSGSLDSQRATIERKVRDTLAAVRQLMPLTGVRIRVRAGGSLIIPELGMGGRALGTDEIELGIDPTSPVLASSLETDLFPLLAHEMHHIMRHRTAGDPSRRRLTLIFHPGRIKRGVGPNREMGPPLRAGETFRLVVDRQLRDFGGEPLQASFEKELRVVAADRSSPDPHSWRVTLPEDAAGSLVLELGEPLDQALLERMISIEDASGRRVLGELVIGDAGTRVSFRPDAAWRPGRYPIVVSPALEDLAGNRIDRLFDEELSPSAEPRSRESLAVRLPFTLEL